MGKNWLQGLVPLTPVLPVASIMTRHPLAVDAEESLDQAMSLMDVHELRHLAVVSAGRLVGLLSDLEVLGASGAQPMRAHEGSRGRIRVHPGRVGEVMRSPAPTIEPGADLLALGQRMLQEQGCLAVVQEDVLVGLVTDRDLLAAFERERLGGAEQDPAAGAIMTLDPPRVHWYTTIAEATRLCCLHALRHLPVMEADCLVGMLSDRVLRRAHGRGRHADTPVGEFLPHNVLSGFLTMRASDVACLLLSRHDGALAITEDGALRGVVTVADLLRHGVAARDLPTKR